MASKAQMSISEELMNAIYIKPYTGLIPYLSPSSALTLSDFEKCPLAKDHWLDLPIESTRRKGRKKRDPNSIFEAFGSYSDHDPIEVREEMLSAISIEFNYYQTVSWLILQLRKLTLSEWCNNMRAIDTPGDELSIFALSKLYKRHSVVYTKDKTWSTIGTSTPMNEKDVYQQCDLKFILMGKCHFVQLIKKPYVSMPLLPLKPMESVYESGYYEDVSPTESKLPTTLVSDPPSGNDNKSTTNHESAQYCAVHGCEASDPHKVVAIESPIIESPNMLEQESVNFPVAAKVCETTTSSTLHDFNPLNESEPNLEFDMTDQDNAENPNLHVKLMQDARTRKWEVKIRNLTQEQVDFISGPRLLPTLAKTDAVVISHDDSETQRVQDISEQEQQTLIDDINHDLPNANDEETSNHPDKPPVNIDEEPTPLSLKAKNKRPKRSTAKNINYSTMTVKENSADSDSDEYTPKPTPPPKLSNKRKPSASRIAAQQRKKRSTDRDKPKQDIINITSQDSKATPVEKPTIGELNIKTVGLPKRVRTRTFKCQICSFVCHSEKERNYHHKDNHGPLTCAVCSEVFDTPSGLHRHKYRHTDLKFTCESCGESFPFESQLKDHRVKHLTDRGHGCFAKDCGRSFKNKSSLIRHLKAHDGRDFPCPEEGCTYSSNVERNLKAHMIVHSDTHPYSCLHCRQAFKHHTQMARHVNNKVCRSSE